MICNPFLDQLFVGIFRGCFSEIAFFSNFENPSNNPPERPAESCDFDSENTFIETRVWSSKNVQKNACDGIAWRNFNFFILQTAGLGLFKIFFTDTIKKYKLYTIKINDDDYIF
jgi:hypothetical protein